MEIKRIFAAFLVAATLGTSAFAYTPYGPAKAEPETEENYDQETTEQNKPSSGTVSSFKPRDYQYQMFEQILDAYVEKHLYEFTEEEVLHKFFEDFLKDNPMYFSYFME
ncbi:MAG: hypothetical protein IJO61_03185, partial [Oscillospiraceae bacterium]|nr:hypothetical protein [Oscillospiraceae bacterium]